jgi:hypothetical protein
MSELLMQEQAQRYSEQDSVDVDDMSVVSAESLFSFDTSNSSLSVNTMFSFDSSTSMSISESYLSETSFDSFVDTMVNETNRLARHVYKPVVDCDVNFDGPTLLIEDLDESKCIHDFRFRRSELNEMATLLWPKISLYLEGAKEEIKCINRYVCHYETGLLLCLFRLSRPRRLRPEMEKYFSMRKSKISAIISTFMDAMYNVAVSYLSDPSIFRHRFEFYNRLIQKKTNLVALKLWGFIDGTLRKTCRPSDFQRIAYSGHKRCHGIKFQSVVTPDGLIAHLFGPVAGSRHDSFLLAESGLIPMLSQLMPPGSPIFSLYGDPAYPQCPYLYSGFRGAMPGSAEAEWNTTMSKVREVVEWLFKEIITKWSFLDFKAGLKIFQFPVAQYYTVGAFLTNLHTCSYGSETCSYFGCAQSEDGRLTMEQYLALVQ